MDLLCIVKKLFDSQSRVSGCGLCVENMAPFPLYKVHVDI